MRLIIETGGDSSHRVIVKPGGLIVIILGLVLALLIILSATAGSLHPVSEGQNAQLTKPAVTSFPLIQPARPSKPVTSAKPVKSGKPAAKKTSPGAPTEEKPDPVRTFIHRFDSGVQQAKSWFSGLLSGHITPAQPAVALSPASHPSAHQKSASHAKSVPPGHPSAHGVRRGAAHPHRTH